MPHRDMFSGLEDTVPEQKPEKIWCYANRKFVSYCPESDEPMFDGCVYFECKLNPDKKDVDLDEPNIDEPEIDYDLKNCENKEQPTEHFRSPDENEVALGN